MREEKEEGKDSKSTTTSTNLDLLADILPGHGPEQEAVRVLEVFISAESLKH